MKYLIAFLALLLPLPAMATSPVVMLGNSTSPFCTAFVVSPEYVISAGHCIFPDPKMLEPVTDLDDLQILPDGAAFPGGLIKGTVVASSNPYAGVPDWVILKVDPKTVPTDLVPLKLDCKYTPTLGDDVTYIGYPQYQGGQQVFEKGYIDILSVDVGPETTPQIGVTIAGGPGASGSPVMFNGNVIGILTAGQGKGDESSVAYFQSILPVCSELDTLNGS